MWLKERKGKYIITDDQGQIIIISRDKVSAVAYAKGLKRW